MSFGVQRFLKLSRGVRWLLVLAGVAILFACFQSRPSGSSKEGQGAGYGRSPAAAPEYSSADSRTLGVIDFARLPSEAQVVIRKIQNREPFPYAKDGTVFSNREGILPHQPRGYYQEYTVVTPNADNRGARRIVSGKGQTGDAASSGEYYYTSDHYRSFARVQLAR